LLPSLIYGCLLLVLLSLPFLSPSPLTHPTPQIQPLSPVNTAPIEVLTKCIILCTGRHARPYIPPIPTDGSVTLLHSSQIPDFECVQGKRVAVVGAGASSLDLCLNTLKANPKGRIEWILREPKHFWGVNYASLLFFYLFQLLCGSFGNYLINLVVNTTMYFKHFISGTISWIPLKPFDVRYAQLVPGRAELLQSHNRRRLSRHVGTEVVEIRDRSLHLSNGTILADIDYLLLGTGYDLPERPEDFHKPAMFAKCLSMGEDRGRLYVFGEDLLDTTGSTPSCALLLSGIAPTIVNDPHVFEEVKVWPEDPKRALNGFEIMFALAPMAPHLYPPFWWRLHMTLVYLYYRLVHRTTIFENKRRRVKLGYNLDDTQPSLSPTSSSSSSSKKGVAGEGLVAAAFGM